ncbi:hypothetical protein [Mesorhizobium sp. WSM3876]|uniref:hypothetical protein n=1 Tax=Mesorhizobium sp. WSM3876 TaxID=422277 RepID=UPI000BAEE631|nr:hypothetical protein [Mesorhizobium sp. WSM3876]PBB83694.1 hypothetical protein CK216_27040 [Mesorhizobium sp. WSM3876]TGT53138.1 hypothetical protein EN813_049655 [Mesorhizobium sp. M00.F.Ca.ET.170.01.1.1]
MSDHASENGNLHEAALDILAKRLAKKADIAEEQARQLIDSIGTDWNALLREAHFLKARH